MPRRSQTPDGEELLRFLSTVLRDADGDLKTRLRVAEMLMKRIDAAEAVDELPPPLIVKVEYVSGGGEPAAENTQKT